MEFRSISTIIISYSIYKVNVRDGYGYQLETNVYDSK